MTRMMLVLICGVAVLNGSTYVISAAQQRAPSKQPPREAAIARAQVWIPSDVRTKDITAGPQGPDAFRSLATVTCDYRPKILSGASPKFVCMSGQDELTVKYGQNNAEVYGEVAATRLLWALGFGADRTYPLRVVCRGCPAQFGGPSAAAAYSERVFDPATIERRMPGRELYVNSSWAWSELNHINEKAGGAPPAHRDALKLLAVFLQHSDSKRQQQRIMCLDESEGGESNGCARPFMMINDLGITFGRATTFNTNSMAMHLNAWAATRVWKPGPRCVGNLPRSWTGTLNDPVIREEGRAFLASLLSQLSDDQLYALFDVSRVTLRLRDPERPSSGLATIEEWVEAFKHKRQEIVQKRCA